MNVSSAYLNVGVCPEHWNRQQKLKKVSMRREGVHGQAPCSDQDRLSPAGTEPTFSCEWDHGRSVPKPAGKVLQAGRGTVGTGWNQPHEGLRTHARQREEHEHVVGVCPACWGTVRRPVCPESREQRRTVGLRLCAQGLGSRMRPWEWCG